MKSKSLNILVFLLIYSNILRLFSSYATLICDFVVVAVLFVNVAIQKKKLSTNSNKIFVGSAIFLIFMSFLQIFNLNINSCLYGLIEFRKSYFQLMWLFVGLFCFAGKDIDLRHNIKFIVLISIPVVLYGIKQYFFLDSFDLLFYQLQSADKYTYIYNNHYRAISIFAGPFHFGMFCVFCYAMCLYLLMNNRNKKECFLNIILLSISLFGCYVSQTRTNMFCCIVIGVIYLLKLFHNGTFFVVLLLILLLVPIVLFTKDGGGFANKSEILDFVESIFNFSTDGRFLGRVTTWEIGIDLIKNNWLFGYGTGSAADTMGNYGVAKIYNTSHNMFLKVFFELGIFGFLLFIAFWVSLFLLISKMKEKCLRWLLFAFGIAIMISALGGSTIVMFPILSMFYLIVGIAIGQNSDKNFKT
jgi:O-antigen ligase